MTDYLTDPTSKPSSITKIKKIRADLKAEKDRVSKKRDKFAKKSLIAYGAVKAGNALLANSLERYKLRNQNQLNALKANKTRATNFISTHNEAMKKHGDVRSYIFNSLQPEYKSQIEAKAGDDYRYDSSHWSDEFNQDLEAKIKSHNEYLEAAYSIADSDPQATFDSIAEIEMPSNIFSYMGKNVRQLVKGENAVTINGKAQKTFDKLIDRPQFAAHKDFQNEMKLYQSKGLTGLTKVLNDMEDEGVLDRKYTQLSNFIQMKHRQVTVQGPEGPITKTEYFVVANVIKQNTRTGATTTTEMEGIDGMVVDGGSVPAVIIDSAKLNAINSVLSRQGQNKLTQLLDQEEYQLYPDKAYFKVLEEGKQLGLQELARNPDAVPTNPYLAGVVDDDVIAEGVATHFGKAMESLMIAPDKNSRKYYSGKQFLQTKFDEDVAIFLSLQEDIAISAGRVVRLVVKNAKLNNLLDAPLPPPSP